jgi:hypothetical protein
MPTTIKMVCLADSRKKGAHCIAGKIIEGRNEGKWIRPISGREECSLNNGDISYENNKLPNLLDIISIPIKENAPSNHHQENCIIDETFYWAKEGEYSFGRLSGLCDDVPELWKNGFHSGYGFNDKVPTSIVHKQIKTSLVLIKPKDVEYRVGLEYSKRKVRAIFKYYENSHTIAVTDKYVENHYLAKKDGTYKDKSEKLFFCVSLGADFNGYCYKLIAGVHAR